MNFSQAKPMIIEGHFKGKVLLLSLPNLGKPELGNQRVMVLFMAVCLHFLHLRGRLSSWNRPP